MTRLVHHFLHLSDCVRCVSSLILHNSIEFETKLHGRSQVLNVTKTDAPQSEVRHGKRLSAFPPDEAIQKIVEKVC
jgi:hypothetical protein